MPSVKEKVFNKIDENKEEIVKALQELIRFPSTAGNEKQAQMYYASLLKELSMEVDVYEPDVEEIKKNFFVVTDRTDFKESPNVAGVLKGKGGGRSIILCGHVDVVPSGTGWKYDPWRAESVNGKIYGRGAVDMKAGNIANVMALKAILQNNIRLKGDVIIESVVEEEKGSLGALGAILRGYKADGAIIPEPTDRNIYAATIGATWFRIKIKGRAAHACAAYTGINAIEKCIPIIQRMCQLEKDRSKQIKDPLYEHIPIPFCINIGKIQGGNWPSTVPQEAVIEGRFGFSPDETLDDVLHMLKETINEVAAEDEWLRDHVPEVELFGTSWYGAKMDIDFPLVQYIKQNGEKIYGEEVKILGAPFCTDGAMFTRFGDTPSVTFGPGYIQMAHENDEYVEIDEVIKATKIIAASILDWCGYEVD
jgi:acetylornithine deacetylase